MNRKHGTAPLSKTNPHLRKAGGDWHARARSVASSTAIETGKSVKAIKAKLKKHPTRHPAKPA